MEVCYIIPKIKVEQTVIYQTTLFSNQDKLILAPMQNLTNYYFRNAFNKFFPNTIDSAVTPFISASNNIKINKNKFKDINKENNNISFPIIPQILGNKPEEILDLVKIIEKMGYRTINLNLGCPKKDIVNKGRGAGLIKNKELVETIIKTILDNTSVNISLKVRLGGKNKEELYNLIPIINSYPLESIIIHPRMAIDMYEGKVDLDSFENIYKEIKRTKVIYNGDIFSKEDFKMLKQRFPQINYWMIGRGILRNPTLAAEIRGINFDKKQLLKPFYKEVFNNFKNSLSFSNDNLVLNKMKEFSKYFCTGNNIDSKDLLRINNINDFLSLFYSYL
jgi:tRNA-dihydrouridine synthase B